MRRSLTESDSPWLIMLAAVGDSAVSVVYWCSTVVLRAFNSSSYAIVLIRIGFIAWHGHCSDSLTNGSSHYQVGIITIFYSRYTGRTPRRDLGKPLA